MKKSCKKAHTQVLRGNGKKPININNVAKKSYLAKTK